MSRSEHVTKRLKLQQMRVFLAVARTGSMANAARHVGISQSVISKSIAELEVLLGVPLFEPDASWRRANAVRRGLAPAQCHRFR